MKKRVLAVLLGGCMVAGLLAGCGGSSSSSSSDSSADTKKADGDSGKGYHFEVVVKSFQSSYAVQGIEQAQDITSK